MEAASETTREQMIGRIRDVVKHLSIRFPAADPDDRLHAAHLAYMAVRDGRYGDHWYAAMLTSARNGLLGIQDKYAGAKRGYGKTHLTDDENLGLAPDWRDGPPTEAERREVEAAVRDAIIRLRGRVSVKRYESLMATVAGQSMPEVARAEGVAASVVNRRVWHCYDLLREELAAFE